MQNLLAVCLTKWKKYAIIIMLCAGVMELADVSDSKSDGSDTVPVRPRSPAPWKRVLVSRACFFISVLILFCLCFTTKSVGEPTSAWKPPQTNGNAPQSRPSLRSGKLTAWKDLRSACVSKSRFFVSYSASKRVCCHCGARHNDEMDLCGTVCRCSNRLRASGTHQYCALTKS